MKTDFKKTDAYQAKQHEFRITTIPVTQYLMVDGHGDPNTAQEFKDAIAALYPLSYKLKFASKKQLNKDYVVMPLEGLWWADDMEKFTTERDKSQWFWTMMIMQPEWITPSMFEVALTEVRQKMNLVKLDDVRLESLDEATVVQTLHVGTFDDEAPTLEEMHAKFIPNNGYRMHQLHHEIYLSDSRKVAPEKMRTLLRQPIIKEVS